MVKLTAYQAAMIRMGLNVDQFEIVERGQESEDGEFFFRNTIFKDFAGDMFVLEVITDDDGQLARPWDKFNDCLAVKRIVNEDGVQYVELEDEEPLQ